MPTNRTEAWARIAALATATRPDGHAPGTIRPLFAADPGRFARFSWIADGLLLDLSKTSLTDAALAALLDLARAVELEAQRARHGGGEPR